MSDDEGEADDLRPDDSVESTPSDAPAIDAEDPQITDATVGEAASAESDDHPSEASPLAPDGKRFKQVWARAKAAEAKLQEEREAKARLEGELSVLKTAPKAETPKAEPRLTWAQLQTAIDNGQLTQTQALEYREETLKKELDAKWEAKLRQERETHSRVTTVSSELAQYRTVLPASVTPGTPERQKVEAAFVDLVQLGYDPQDPRTELLAARQAFGSIAVLKDKKAAAASPQGRETMQDMPANGKPKADAKDPLKTISAAQRTHYQRMIDRGMYKGWAEVREELAFVPPR